MDQNIWQNILILSQNIKVKEVCKLWHSLVNAYEKSISKNLNLSQEIIDNHIFSEITDNFSMSSALKYKEVLEWTAVYRKIFKVSFIENSHKYAKIIVKSNLLYYPKELKYAIKKQYISYAKYMLNGIAPELKLEAIQYIIECCIYYHQSYYLFVVAKELGISIPSCIFKHPDCPCASINCIILNMQPMDDPIMKASIMGKYSRENTDWLIKTTCKKFGKWLGYYAVDNNLTNLISIINWVYDVEYNYEYWLSLRQRAFVQGNKDLTRYIDLFFP